MKHDNRYSPTLAGAIALLIDVLVVAFLLGALAVVGALFFVVLL